MKFMTPCGALLGPVLAGRRDADQDVDRAVGREVLRLRLAERIAGRDEALPDEGLPRVALRAFGVVDVDGDDGDAGVARALDELVEGVVVDDRGDQRVRLGRERGLHVGRLLLRSSLRSA